MQAVITAEPSDPFTVLEGNNITLEWSYNLGASGSFRRIEFIETTSSPIIRILEIQAVGQTPFVQRDYIGRLQVDVSATRTLITILGANRTLDRKDFIYQFDILQDSTVSSTMTILVQCKYKSRSVDITLCEKRFQEYS